MARDAQAVEQQNRSQDKPALLQHAFLINTCEIRDAIQNAWIPARRMTGASIREVTATRGVQMLHPFRLLLISLAGYLSQKQQDVIDCFLDDT